MSLKIKKSLTDAAAVMTLEGRLDTSTAPELEAELETLLPAVTALTLDLAKLEYISSAGLRVLLKAQKEMCRRGGMKLIRVPEAVMEVFDITGFADFLTVED